jgi:hypothetical protein
MKKEKFNPAQDFAKSLETVKGRKEIIAWCKREVSEYTKLIMLLEK